MSNDLANAGDGFGVPENSGKNQYIVGKMIKFVDGTYIVDKTETLPADTELVAIGVVTAWVHWVDGKPVEHRVTHYGEVHPDREDLPDQDEAEWPPGLDGEPSDPWKDTRYLRLIDPRTGTDYTFVTDSYGGRRGVGNLKSQITNVRMACPGAVPVVKLGSAPFKTTFGLKKRPDFEVVDWRNRGDGPTGDTPAGDVPPKPLPRLSDTKPAHDDQIPF
jgi:hypothetical protein